MRSGVKRRDALRMLAAATGTVATGSLIVSQPAHADTGSESCRYEFSGCRRHVQRVQHDLRRLLRHRHDRRRHVPVWERQLDRVRLLPRCHQQRRVHGVGLGRFECVERRRFVHESLARRRRNLHGVRRGAGHLHRPCRYDGAGADTPPAPPSRSVAVSSPGSTTHSRSARTTATAARPCCLPAIRPPRSPRSPPGFSSAHQRQWAVRS